MNKKEIYIGRQPILDKDGKCAGFELLYRQNYNSDHAFFSDNAEATARVIINLMHNLGTSPIIGSKPGYINVNETILMSDILLSLPKSKFIFEILEYTAITEPIVERIRYLHGLGYRFALDDFSFENEQIEAFSRLLPYTDVVKIDLLAVPLHRIDEMIARLQPYNVKLLAEKVENIDVFDRCKKAGFELFQGYFFEKPTIMVGKKIEPAASNAIRMINILGMESNPDVIAKEFSLCPDITYSLLRYINSAEFHFQREITSIKQILMLLGIPRIRSWLGLFLYSGAEDRIFHEAIINTAKFRGCFMRELALLMQKTTIADEAFLTGTLSLIDTYMHIQMEELLSMVNLSSSIKDALLDRKGEFGLLLSMVEKMEPAESMDDILVDMAEKLQIDPDEIYDAYWRSMSFEIGL